MRACVVSYIIDLMKHRAGGRFSVAVLLYINRLRIVLCLCSY